jgi:hypothetical protein
MSGHVDVTYAHALRAIGQAMNEQRLEDFELEAYENAFLVRGKKKATEKGILRRLQRRPSDLSFRYTFEDIEQLDHEGQLKRRNPDGVPDFYSLPQVLRTVGAYLDMKNARLVSVSRRGPRLTIEYEKLVGERISEEHSIASFYDLFVKLYLRRSSRL